MRTTFMRFLIVYITITQIFAFEDEACSSINSTKHDIQWPSTTNITFSQPLCLNQKKEFLYRQCLDGKWSTETDCDYIQMTEIPQCPKGFTDAGTFCYTLTEKSPFPPKCPFNNVLPFSTYKNLIGTEIRGGVWIPVKRDLSNGLGFLLWVEYSTLYKSIFSDDYIYDGTIKGKDCLVYYNNSTIVAKSCNEEFQSVCAYAKLGMAPILCGAENKCLQHELSANSKCICLGSLDNSSFPMAEFLEPYQNLIYSMLTNETCGIGLQKISNSTYIWNSTNESISYSYWSTDVIFDDLHIYGAVTPKGWVLTQQPSPIILFEKELEEVETSLFLEFIETAGVFNVTITNYHGLKKQNSDVLINCFTDAHPTTLLYRYSNLTLNPETDNKAYINLKMYTDAPGYYWCESFRYNESEVVSSNIVPAQFFGAEFVVILKLNFKNINPLSEDIVELVTNTVFPLFDNNTNLLNYVYRIMKILDVDEDEGAAWINFHLSESGGVDTVEEYVKVSNSINEAINNSIEIQIKNLLSVRYCLDEVSKNLTWPRTDDKVTSEEYCFKSDGTLVERQCMPNVIDGASWGPIENCEVPKSSELANELLVLIYNESYSIRIEEVNSVVKKFGEFQPFDVYLVGLIVGEYVLSYDGNLSCVVEILNKLLEVDEMIILETQQKMRGVSKILCFLKNTLKDRVSDGYYFLNNIGIASMGLDNMTSLLITTNENNRNVSTLNDYPLPDELIKRANLECAISLSLQLIEEIKNENPSSTLVFVRHFKTSFFTQIDEYVINIFTIGRLFPVTVDDNHYKGEVQVVHKIPNIGTFSEAACVYFDDNNDSWINITTTKIGTDFLVCKFNSANHFGLLISFIDDKSSNVTIILEDLLYSDLPSSETMKRLQIISQRHNEFVSVDVYLVGQLLKKISTDQNIDLNVLTATINNLHNINQTVLYDSQIENRATDSILYHIDTIIQNQQTQMYELHVSDNFVTMVIDLKTTNFTGVVLLQINQTYRVDILEHDINATDLLSDENFDSALILSSQLLEQINDTVSITMFFSNVLFNEKNGSSNTVTKIFGVILPTIGTYEGPLSIYHRKLVTSSQNCDHWDYDEVAGTSGFWKRDSDGEEIEQMLIQCQYWHTTHFALVLLDDLKYNDDALDWITSINFSVSFLGLCIIIATAFFKEWRTNSGNQVLLNFTFATMLQIVMFYISSITPSLRDSVGCVIVGSLLHYSIISNFCWMLVVAILQFRRFVIVFVETPEYFLLKTCLFSWGLPIIPVVGLLIADHQNYVVGNVGLCYPTGYGLYVGVWLPAGVIVMINFVIFVYILNSVIQRKVESVAGSNDAIYQWRLAILLFFSLGLTWVFGLLMDFDLGIVFSYLFTLTATLQGFVMFLFFVALNKSTRALYSKVFRTYFRTKKL